jgi:hypothetical protein
VKSRIRSGVRVRTYDVLARAVEEGVAYGVRRAHKHHDQPSEEHVQDEVIRSVMVAIGEVLDFDEEPDGG